MSKYTISCSKEQVEKSLKLGAEEELLTAEEMIGWLEKQDDIEEITILRNRAFHSWAYLVTNKRDKLVSSNNIYQSRPEATIAAIDAALEYLSSIKLFNK